MKELPAKAVKIIALALNGAAAEGEWQSAAIKFVAALRAVDFPAEFFEPGAPLPPKGRPRPMSSGYPMPFGKFQGSPVADLPDWYLDWLAREVDLRDPLDTAVANEMAWRAQV